MTAIAVDDVYAAGAVGAENSLYLGSAQIERIGIVGQDDPVSALVAYLYRLGLRGGFLGVPGGRHEGDLALLASAESRRGAGRDLELGQLGASGPLPGAVPVERRGVRRGGDGGEGGPLRLRMGRGGHRGTPRELLQRPRHVGADVLPERRHASTRVEPANGSVIE